MTTYTLTFTDEDMAVIERAIAELPFRLASPLVAKINGQISEAQKAESSETGAVPEHMRHGADAD